MSWLISSVLLVMPLEALAYDHPAAFATLPVRAGLLVTLLVALQINRLTPVAAGRLFLAQGLATMVGFSLLVHSPPDRIVVESVAYGTILSIFALLIAPRHSRRRWSLSVLGVVLVPAVARLVPNEMILLAQTFAVLAVHAVAVALLDVHTNRVEAAGEMASYDPLTGLRNRRPTLERIEESIERVGEGGAPSSIVILDLDYFKVLNDTMGHDAGDAALSRVAHVLVDAVRDIDLVSRWGGEEFLIVLDGVSERAAAATAQRLRSLVAATGVTASFGVAGVDAGESAKDWIRRADDAMYAAKRAGRDRVVTHSSLAAAATIPIERRAMAPADGQTESSCH